jgi:alpha-ketoglutarate-dependent taurine dioxygenase
VSTQKLMSIAGEVAGLLPGVRGTGYGPGNGFPCFIVAADPQLRQDPDAVVAWHKANRLALDQLITRVGAIVLRDFAVTGTAIFDRLAEDYPEPQFGYTAGGSPRAAIPGASRAYEATRAPSNLKLPLHQEMSYLPAFPDRVAFYCRKAPDTGGETTIADMREFTRRVRPGLLEEVIAKGVKYIRRFRNPEWVTGNADADTTAYRPWDEAFGTSDPKAAEEKCREMGLTAEWSEDGFLSTYYVTAGARPHPETGEMIWFNQATAQSLRPETRGVEGYRRLKEAIGDKQWPLDVVLGDGTRIPEDDMKALYALYSDLEVSFPWQEGDVMIIDNYIASHGRAPFTGARDVEVALLGRA